MLFTEVHSGILSVTLCSSEEGESCLDCRSVWGELRYGMMGRSEQLVGSLGDGDFDGSSIDPLWDKSRDVGIVNSLFDMFEGLLGSRLRSHT